MKILFLGTGAADWDISLHNTSRDFRRFSSALVNGELLIDPGPCVFEFAESFGYTQLLENVKYVINTHTHADHFSIDTLDRLYDMGAKFIEFDAGETKAFGNYTISAVFANHKTASDAKHYIITDSDKSLFYGLDGAWLTYEEVRELNKVGSVDLMVLDATIGDIDGDYRIFEHNNLRMVEEMVLTLKNRSKRFIISHMARTLHTSHDELAERMKRSEIDVAYDNLEIEF